MPSFPGLSENLVQSCALPALPPLILEGNPAVPRTCTGWQIGSPFYRKQDKLYATETQVCSDTGAVFAIKGSTLALDMCCPGNPGGDSIGISPPPGPGPGPVPPVPINPPGPTPPPFTTCPGSTCCINLSSCTTAANLTGTITVTGPTGTQTLTLPNTCFAVPVPGTYTITVTVPGYTTTTVTVNLGCNPFPINIGLAPDAITLNVCVFVPLGCGYSIGGANHLCRPTAGITITATPGGSATADATGCATFQIPLSSIPSNGNIQITVPKFCDGMEALSVPFHVSTEPTCVPYNAGIPIVYSPGYHCCGCYAIPNSVTLETKYGNLVLGNFPIVGSGTPPNPREPECRTAVPTNTGVECVLTTSLKPPREPIPIISYSVQWCGDTVTVTKSGMGTCGDYNACTGYLASSTSMFGVNAMSFWESHTVTVPDPCHLQPIQVTFTCPSSVINCPCTSVPGWAETVTVRKT
jgi:hypothetical protein